MRNTLVFCVLALLVAALVPKIVGEGGTSSLPLPPPSSRPAAVPLPSADLLARADVIVPVSTRSIVIAPDRRGHFLTDGMIDGRRMRFMVDTGASVIALTKEHAARLGIHPLPRDYTLTVGTANGSVRAAPTMLRAVEIGGITVRDVRAMVLPDGALQENLLGMSFLSKLRRFEYRDGRLVLEQ